MKGNAPDTTSLRNKENGYPGSVEGASENETKGIRFAERNPTYQNGKKIKKETHFKNSRRTAISNSKRDERGSNEGRWATFAVTGSKLLDSRPRSRNEVAYQQGNGIQTQRIRSGEIKVKHEPRQRSRESHKSNQELMVFVDRPWGPLHEKKFVFLSGTPKFGPRPTQTALSGRESGIYSRSRSCQRTTWQFDVSRYPKFGLSCTFGGSVRLRFKNRAAETYTIRMLKAREARWPNLKLRATGRRPWRWEARANAVLMRDRGNNVISFKGAQTATTAQSAAGLVFNYPQSATTAPKTTANINAARANAFCVVNNIHDLSYGLTEAAFNFQNNNFGKGGARNDRITISVQNSAGIECLFRSLSSLPSFYFAFSSFIWMQADNVAHTATQTFLPLPTANLEPCPERDGALENDIVTHETTHGITNRMTGGGTDRCLQTTEAGMGEGRCNEKTTSAVPDYVLGQDVINDPAGIRFAPVFYLRNRQPPRLRTPTEVHDIGEVWANILHNVYAAFVTAHGFSTTARTNPAGTLGQHRLPPPLHRCPRAPAVQPHLAFASRGLCPAAANHVDSTTVPAMLRTPACNRRPKHACVPHCLLGALLPARSLDDARAPSSRSPPCLRRPCSQSHASSLGRRMHYRRDDTVAGTLQRHRFANPRLARTPKRANVLLHTPGGPREDAHRRTRAQYELHPPPSLSEFYEDCQRATTFFQRV
ncbi:Fungalysin metallopeptidase-domain-containing protein [Mycena olivaceomarginata]|nr:Fungalysin metallopeptidase-domain-containing protein [Mycena olivaceomarginata]